MSAMKKKTMNIYLENDLLVLNSVVCHYGVPGMKHGKHDPNKRWQRHAVYAKGRPDPNAKKGDTGDAVGIKRKSGVSDWDAESESKIPSTKNSFSPRTKAASEAMLDASLKTADKIASNVKKKRSSNQARY